jgi:membrane protein CcdC involved in cytochrome C biogenesis
LQALHKFRLNVVVNVSHIYAIVLGAKGLSIRMIMGSQRRTLGHNKSVKPPLSMSQGPSKTPFMQISPAHAIA